MRTFFETVWVILLSFKGQNYNSYKKLANQKPTHEIPKASKYVKSFSYFKDENPYAIVAPPQKVDHQNKTFTISIVFYSLTRFGILGTCSPPQVGGKLPGTPLSK